MLLVIDSFKIKLNLIAKQASLRIKNRESKIKVKLSNKMWGKSKRKKSSTGENTWDIASSTSVI